MVDVLEQITCNDSRILYSNEIRVLINMEKVTSTLFQAESNVVLK